MNFLPPASLLLFFDTLIVTLFTTPLLHAVSCANSIASGAMFICLKNLEKE